ncbi:MAG: YncE family protein [Bryobacterales bacterium]|nr:YncE family protein [Bryobacterales bacterium]
MRLKSDPPVTRRRVLSMAGAAAASLVGCRGEAEPFSGFAAVVKANSPFVALVDLAAFTLTGKIEFEAPISQVLFAPGPRLLYAVSASSGTIFEYDWAARRHTRQVRVGESLVEARFDPREPWLWVSVSAPPSLVKIPLREFVQHSWVPLPAAPISFDAANWEARLAASLTGGGVALVNHAESREAGVLRTAEQFGLVRFRSDGKQFLAANLTDRSISVVRAADAVSLVDLPVAMEARNFCFKPDGGQLFVTDGQSGGVAMIYPYTTEVDRAVLAGKSPGAMAACASPPYLLVANRESSDITVLDLDSGKLVAIVPVGAAPAFIAITPDNQYALALNAASGDMAVIRLSAVRSRRNKSAPLFTMIPVGEAPVSLTVIPA